METHIPDFTSIPNPFHYTPTPRLRLLDPLKSTDTNKNTLNDRVILEIDHLLYQNTMDRSIKDPHITETIEKEG